MDRTSHNEDQADLVSTLDVIEGQPLASRAEAYDSLHDALARTLESGPGAGAHARP